MNQKQKNYQSLTILLNKESLEQLRKAVTLANKGQKVIHATDNPEILKEANKIKQLYPEINIISRETEQKLLKLKMLKTPQAR